MKPIDSLSPWKRTQQVPHCWRSTREAMHYGRVGPMETDATGPNVVVNKQDATRGSAKNCKRGSTPMKLSSIVINVLDLVTGPLILRYQLYHTNFSSNEKSIENLVSKNVNEHKK